MFFVSLSVLVSVSSESCVKPTKDCGNIIFVLLFVGNLIFLLFGSALLILSNSWFELITILSLVDICVNLLSKSYTLLLFLVFLIGLTGNLIKLLSKSKYPLSSNANSCLYSRFAF